MAGVWKRTMQYLGLVEDDELEDLDEGTLPASHHEPTAVRRLRQ